MIKVQAKYWWNRTPFRLEAGERYRFNAEGAWKDARHECHSTGYSDEFLDRWNWLKREPTAKWFSLIGQIDRNRATQFDIGHLIEMDETYTATATGTLFCFANDAWLMYWNNGGAIGLEMVEVL